MAVILQQIDRRTHAAYTGSNDNDGGIGHILVADLQLKSASHPHSIRDLHRRRHTGTSGHGLDISM